MAREAGEARLQRRSTRMVVLTVPGEKEPEVYVVCSDVFGILGKMLAVNQLSGSFGSGPRFEYDEVRFLLTLLGAPHPLTMEEELRPVDLWISGE